MNPIVAFILGLLLGWLIEWVIDWFYWRRKYAKLQAEADASRTRVAELERDAAKFQRLQVEADASRGRTAELEQQVAKQQGQQAEADAACRTRVAELEQEVATYKNQVTDLQAEAARAASVPALVRDPLQNIQGLSPEIDECLKGAGIHTFASLGALTPKRLKELLGDLPLKAGGEVEIIQQARLTSGMIKKVDDLEAVNGIGPVIARILNQAGVFTFNEVSSLDAAGLREIVGERIQRLADEDKIIAHARQLADQQGQGG
jgi:predicted flap endonuclease-1-like 5' DNA nuclease